MLGDLTYLVWFQALISDALRDAYGPRSSSSCVFNDMRTVRAAGALGREFGQWVAFKGSVLGIKKKKETRK